MAKVTSKLQLTIPKVIADRYKIRPGDELEWLPAGDTIRVVPQNSRSGRRHVRSVKERLNLFHKMLERQRKREANPDRGEDQAQEGWKPHEVERGWRREDLYTRGRPR